MRKVSETVEYEDGKRSTDQRSIQKTKSRVKLAQTVQREQRQKESLEKLEKRKSGGQGCGEYKRSRCEMYRY